MKKFRFYLGPTAWVGDVVQRPGRLRQLAVKPGPWSAQVDEVALPGYRSPLVARVTAMPTAPAVVRLPTQMELIDVLDIASGNFGLLDGSLVAQGGYVEEDIYFSLVAGLPDGPVCLENGLICRSGVGTGSYPLEAVSVEGRIVVLRIRFLEPGDSTTRSGLAATPGRL